MIIGRIGLPLSPTEPFWVSRSRHHAECVMAFAGGFAVAIAAAYLWSL